MRQLSEAELRALIQGSDLFEEFRQVAAAGEYLDLLARCRAVELLPGERLPAGTRAAVAILEGSAVPAAAPGEMVPTGRRVHGQWSGIRGEGLGTDLIASEKSACLELPPDAIRRLVDGPASRFKVEFFRPLLWDVASLVDLPTEHLESSIRRSKFFLAQGDRPIVMEGAYGGTMFFILAGAVCVDPGEQEVVLGPGEFFGEIAALAYIPRSATVKPAPECLLMECDRDVLADLRRRGPTFRTLVQDRYRERAMLAQLRDTWLFADLRPEELRSLAAVATLEQFEPYEPLFFQGDTPDALYVVLNGHVSVVEEREGELVPVAWVGDGETVGELSLLPGVALDDRRGQTVAAIQRVDAIRIGRESIGPLLEFHPTVESRLTATARLRREANAAMAAPDQAGRAAALGWIFETQHVQGNWVLAVDMVDCIRCGNCVAACEEVHPDGINRFQWRGLRQDDAVLPGVRLSNSCQHCEVALCQKPCPANCIDRDPLTGAVFIDYERCIRCGKCADPSQGCPYGSIAIIPAAEVPGRLASEPPPLLSWLTALLGRNPPTSKNDTPARTGKNYPVKCDLCHGLPRQACVESCPTDAVFRVDGDRQFRLALERTGRRNASPPDGLDRPLVIGLCAEFASPPTAGKPAELVIRLLPEGDGTPIRLRHPERGVPHITLNFYLQADESFRIGGGGPLRQVELSLSDLRGSVDYALTQKTPGEYGLTLLAYQGGLYLGRIPVALTVIG